MVKINMVHILRGDITPVAKCTFCGGNAFPKKSLIRKQMIPLSNGKMATQTFIKCQNCIEKGVQWLPKKV